MDINLGPIRQVAYVVKDIELAMRQWVALGVGPWFYVENAPIDNFVYSNKPSHPDLSIALTNSGPIQLELIQQRNDAPSMYRDFIRSGQEGMHHVAYWTEQFDDHKQIFLENGYQIGHSGNVGEDGRFIYFAHAEAPGNVIELSEVVGFKGELFKAIAAAAIGWDGSDPIRR